MDLLLLCLQECRGSMAQSAWRCPHLTSLRVCSALRVSPPAIGAAHCTSLRQLQLDGCTLDGGAFPASLCSALRHLSSLAVLRSGLTSLPLEFSQLRCAGLRLLCAATWLCCIATVSRMDQVAAAACASSAVPWHAAAPRYAAFAKHHG